ncbi:MAG: cysteine-S-conjugate beta-lyase [Thermoplasmata archaeon]|jgi:cystathionine gamma-lyase/homocysteine desulfhydrase|nr:cysteine-S-conjugate beta-lyase [Thermoplasmata archaeon]MEA3165545.1 cysteine-S-conjugate beta-lyase [Thermoplasmata archaeon]
MAKLAKKDSFATKCVHAGIHPDAEHGSVNPAIHLTTTYVQPAPAQPKTFDYARAGNPTRQALEESIAILEGGVTGHAFASGLSALDAILRTLDSGDHVVAAEDSYGGSMRLLNKVYARQGIKTTFVDTQDPANTAKAMTKSTKLVLMETPTNPLLRVSDIKATAEVAHDGKAKLVVDNTFMSPALQNPLALGADYVFHSATKYIGGHSDVLAGLVVTGDKADGERIKFLQLAVGAVLDPFDSFMLLRGLKTLDLRMARHAATAQTIAERLAKHKAVEKVFYPGLPKHPNHKVNAKQAKNGGGMLSFSLGSDAKVAAECVKATRLFQLAESLGAVESLIQIPALMTHASVPPEIRKRTGLADGLIRLSPGIEDVEDLWSDLKQAIEKST